MKKLPFFTAFISLPLFANDSTGFVATGGVAYLKNPQIAMESEALFLSQEKVEVNYQYRNLTDKAITETLLFPLPLLPMEEGMDFADTASLIKQFTISANGKNIAPKIHVRALMLRKSAPDQKAVDVTPLLKQCGFRDQEIINQWTKRLAPEAVAAKFARCQARLPELQQYEDGWAAQIVYAWKQTFAPNTLTHIRHVYPPLVGNLLNLREMAQFDATLPARYCLRGKFLENLPALPANQMGYILKTGANWAKPIQHFSLTIERPLNAQVHFCWNGSTPKKITQGERVQFLIQETDFSPNQDLDLLFVPIKAK